jgi:hypothetical protein
MLFDIYIIYIDSHHTSHIKKNKQKKHRFTQKSTVKAPPSTLSTVQSFHDNFLFQRFVQRFEIKRLCRHFRDARVASRCPLATAFFNGHLECAKALMSHGGAIGRRGLCLPVGPPPCPFPSMDTNKNRALRFGNPPLDLAERSFTWADAATLGRELLSCKTYRHGLGWTDEDDHVHADEYARDMDARARNKREKLHDARLAARQVRREVKRLKDLNDRLSDAVNQVGGCV